MQQRIFTHLRFLPNLRHRHKTILPQGWTYVNRPNLVVWQQTARVKDVLKAFLLERQRHGTRRLVVQAA